MAFEDWLRKRLHFTDAVPLPDGATPPYYVTGPTMKQLEQALESIGWPKDHRPAYGGYVAPDGNPVTIVYCRSDLKDRNGTLFVCWGKGNFHKDRTKMIDDLIEQGWNVRDLPGRG